MKFHHRGVSNYEAELSVWWNIRLINFSTVSGIETLFDPHRKTPIDVDLCVSGCLNHFWRHTKS